MSNAEPASVGDLLQVVSAAAAESSPPLALRRLIPPGATAETMQTAGVRRPFQEPCSPSNYGHEYRSNGDERE